MIDLTLKINNAKLLSCSWTHDKVRQALSTLAGYFPGDMVDWEEGDEEWGRVISRGEATAYVSARLPLAFVRSDHETAAQQVSLRMEIITISVPDFDAPAVTVDLGAISDLSGRALTKNVSYDRASVNDIWWATI